MCVVSFEWLHSWEQNHPLFSGHVILRRLLYVCSVYFTWVFNSMVFFYSYNVTTTNIGLYCILI